MFSNILFLLYMVFLGCAIPVSIGINHGLKRNKSVWAHSVHYMVTRQAELICFDDETCMPITESYGAGTSFVVEYIGNNSIMMTAAHLCNPIELPEQTMLKENSLMKSVHSVGLMQEEYILKIEDILYVDEETDICVFSVPVLLGITLELADSDIKYGENVWSIGAPAGYFPPTAKPITQGLYSGDAERMLEGGEFIPFSNFNMPTVPGMSGSPIINKKGEVVGIVSAVNVDWHMISYSPTVHQIKSAKKIAIEKFKSRLK